MAKTQKSRGQKSEAGDRKKTAAQKKPAASAARKPVKKGRPAKRGRPVAFCWKTAEQVLNGIAAGESLTKVCAAAPMPTRKTVSGWVRRGVPGDDADLRAFAQGFVLACQVRRALLEDDFVELIARIRNATRLDLLEGDAIRFKLEMDGLKWYLGKFRPGAQLEGVEEALNRLDGSEEGEGDLVPRFMMRVVKPAEEVSDA